MRGLYCYELISEGQDWDRLSHRGASREEEYEDEKIFKHGLFFHYHERVHNIATWADDISTLVVECERSSVIEIDRVDTTESRYQDWYIHHRYLLDRSHLDIVILGTTDP